MLSSICVCARALAHARELGQHTHTHTRALTRAHTAASKRASADVLARVWVLKRGWQFGCSCVMCLLTRLSLPRPLSFFSRPLPSSPALSHACARSFCLSVVCVQEDGEEHRLVYAAYHPCATRKVPCPPCEHSPLPLCARPLSGCMFDGAGSADSASGRQGARHVCQAPALCVTCVKHIVRSVCHSLAAALVHTHTPFGISLLTCYLPSHECLAVSECVLAFGCNGVE